MRPEINLNKFNMKQVQFLVIQGKCNSGKTTTTRMVYKELSLRASEVKFLCNRDNNQWVTGVDLPNDPADFTALMTVNGKKVGIISAGDVATTLERDIKNCIQEGADIIICCVRSRGSSLKLLKDNYFSELPCNYKIFSVEDLPDFNEGLKIKGQVADVIVNKVLNIIKELNTNA